MTTKYVVKAHYLDGVLDYYYISTAPSLLGGSSIPTDIYNPTKTGLELAKKKCDLLNTPPPQHRTEIVYP